jgi:hypothetical protein
MASLYEILKNDIKCFKENDFTKFNITDFMSVLRDSLRMLNDFKIVVDCAKNADQINDFWIKITIEHYQLLNDTMSEINEYFLVSKEVRDKLEIVCNEQHQNFSKINPLFGMEDDFQLMVLLNYEKIHKLLDSLYSYKYMTQNLRFNFNHAKAYLPYQLNMKFKEIIKTKDTRIINNFLDFLQKIKNTIFHDQINEKIVKYLKMVLDGQSKELIHNLKQCDDQTLIDDKDIIREVGNLLDNELGEVSDIIHKLKKKCCIDKNNKIRPIHIKQFDDVIDHHKKLSLSPEYLNIVEEYISGNGQHKAHQYVECVSTVFTLEEIPGIIFKIVEDDRFMKRCRNHLFARKVCKYYGLKYIRIPKMGFIRKHNIIFEELFDIEPKQIHQEELYEKYAHKMEETIRQFTKFCCLTGIDDVIWRNIPLLNNSLNSKQVKIGVVDLDEFESIENSIFGGFCGRIGLIRCVQESLFPIIANEYENMTGDKIDIDTNSTFRMRREELKFDSDLRNHYAQENIVRNEFVILNTDLLQFDEYEEDDQKDLVDMCLKIVDGINETLDKRLNMPLKHLRNMTIDRNLPAFSGVRLGREIHKKGDDKTKYSLHSFDKVALEELERIGVIYKLIKYYGSNPIVQV